MTIEFSHKCQKLLAKIKKKDKSLFNKIEKQLLLFQTVPDHSSLRLHKFSGAQAGTWSIAIDMSYRLLFYSYQPNKERRVVFFTVGKHKEVYK